MGIGIIGVIVVVIAAVLLLKLIKFGLKIIGFVIFAFVLGITIWICTTQPDLHKPFSMNTIEYLFNINKDGSITTQKQITEVQYKKEAK